MAAFGAGVDDLLAAAPWLFLSGITGPSGLLNEVAVAQDAERNKTSERIVRQSNNLLLFRLRV